MKKINLIVFAVLLTATSLFVDSCKQLQGISQALTNIGKLEFKLDGITNFRLADIDISRKSSIKSFSVTDGLKLTKAFSSKQFIADFILNIEAKNPNDGTNNTKQVNATLSGLDWDLYIDNVKTVSGGLGAPVSIPGGGSATVIPLAISLDLYEFFGKKGYDGIINLALNLGGMSGSASNVRLEAQPTVTTAFGKMAYPGKITIIDKQFN